MGERSRAYFDEANRLGGLVAKIRLASLAQVTSAEASSAEDDPKTIERLERAMAQIRGELKASEAKPDASIGRVVPSRAGVDDGRVLRRHLQTFVDLMTQRSLFLGDVNMTIRRIDEAAATMTVRAGTPLEAVQNAARDARLATDRPHDERGSGKPHDAQHHRDPEQELPPRRRAASATC